ncbi:hypothetical protein GCM10009678_01200 [Actinomadura kijaniata]
MVGCGSPPPPVRWSGRWDEAPGGWGRRRLVWLYRVGRALNGWWPPRAALMGSFWWGSFWERDVCWLPERFAWWVCVRVFSGG